MCQGHGVVHIAANDAQLMTERLVILIDGRDDAAMGRETVRRRQHRECHGLATATAYADQIADLRGVASRIVRADTAGLPTGGRVDIGRVVRRIREAVIRAA